MKDNVCNIFLYIFLINVSQNRPLLIIKKGSILGCFTFSSSFPFKNVSRELASADQDLNTSCNQATLSTLLPVAQKYQDLSKKMEEIIKASRLPPKNSIFDFFDRGADFLREKLFASSIRIEKEELRATIGKVQHSLDRIGIYLKKNQDSIAAQKKWADYKLPEKVVKEYPDLVRKLYLSGDLFSMVGYARGKEDSPLFKEENGSVMLLYKGQYVFCAEFNGKVELDTKLKRLFTKSEDGGKEWISAVSPSQGGFVPLDHNVNTKMDRPVDRVSQEEFNDIITHANRFDRGVNQPKKTVAVLQVCTRLGNTTGAVPKNLQRFIDGNEENIPSHYFCHLIDSNRDVHSFGMGVVAPISARDQVLTTKRGAITNDDYCEFRDAAGDMIVTSIPLSQQEVDLIKQRASTVPSHFQLFQSSCASFVSGILSDLKINAPIKTSLESFFFRMIRKPILEMPGVLLFASQVNKIINIGQRFFKNHVPKPIQNAVSRIGEVVSLPFQPGFAFVKSLILQSFGGADISDAFLAEEQREGVKPMVNSWESRWDLRASDIYNSIELLDWQLRQTNSERFVKKKSGKPIFHLLKKFEKVGV